MSVFLITGAAGFIGSKVANLLLRDGHSVKGIDNFDDYYDCRLKIWRLSQATAHPKFSFEKCDIEEAEGLRRCARSWGPIDAMIHLAAKPGVRASVINPRACLETNLLGTLNVLEVCRERAIPKLVIASSSSVYGASRELPYREDQANCRPLSPYAASKKAAEDLCFTYHHLYQLDVSVLRFFTVYGPAGRPDMAIFNFIRKIMEGEPLNVNGDGNQSRDFSFVDDIARGVLCALKATGFRVFNLGANHPVKLNTAIRLIEQLSGKTAIIQRQAREASDVSDTWADIERAKTELDWSPIVSLETGLDLALRWYIDNRSWASTLSAQPGSGSRPTAEELLNLGTALRSRAQERHEAPAVSAVGEELAGGLEIKSS